MSILISLLPVLLTVLLFGAFVKLAARMRRAQLAWTHAFVFALLIIVIGGAGAFVNRSGALTLPLAVAVIAGLLLQLGIGGWYLGPRAKNAAGEAIRFRGGAMLSFIAYLLLFALGIVSAFVIPLLARHAAS
jgi:hypothetical protein